jgi:integrase/recombinase XerD
MNPFPCLVRSSSAGGEAGFALGDPLVDSYLAFVAGRSRPNTLRAVAHDLKTFFSVIDKNPVEVVAADIFDFVASQRGDRTVIRITRWRVRVVGPHDRPPALVDLGPVCVSHRPGRHVGEAEPGPAGPVDATSGRPPPAGPVGAGPAHLPKILSPAGVTALLGALRTHRDRAMVYAMVLGGLRRCEVLGLTLGHIQVPERSLFIAEGKGGHQRVIPISNTFFASVGDYLRKERPKPIDTDRVFVTLKGPNRGQPMTPDGVDKILQAARARAGLDRATCHQLRHTCLTRLREAGMELEAVQAQAGHVSIESTRIYLHLTDDWLASEYRRASQRIDADAAAELVAMQGITQ